MSTEVLEATTSFATELDGTLYNVSEGFTRVSADHVLALTYPQHFRPVAPSAAFRTEDATDEPGRPRERYEHPAPLREAPKEPEAPKPPEPAKEPEPRAKAKPRPTAPRPSGLTTQSVRKEVK